MCGQTTTPGGRYLLDPSDERAFAENEVVATDVRQSIDRMLRSVFVCGSQPVTSAADWSTLAMIWRLRPREPCCESYSDV
jgi:hypothetical protein